MPAEGHGERHNPAIPGYSLYARALEAKLKTSGDTVSIPVAAKKINLSQKPYICGSIGVFTTFNCKDEKGITV